MDENRAKLWAEIKHFTPIEFDSPDLKGSGENMNIEFVSILDKIREKVGFPLLVNSGYRTEAHNLIVGGEPGSAHTRGVAVDIQCSTSADRYEIINAFLVFGLVRIGIGESFIHLDMDYSKPQRVCWLYPKGGKG